MSETFTFTGTVRRLGLDEFVLSAGGKTLARPGTVVIESEGGAIVAFTDRDGFIATFGRDPLAPVENPYLSDEARERFEEPAESILSHNPPLPSPKPAPEPAPPARKKAPAKAKK